MTPLSYEFIKTLNLQTVSIRPDWDDAGYEFTLPSGFNVRGYFMLNNRPCEMSILGGLDGWLYIETQEDLQEFLNLDYAKTLDKILKDCPEFPINKYDYE
jgi:hypothetical protein